MKHVASIWSRCLVVMAVIVSPTFADAQTLLPPTDVDMHAGYCMPVVRHALDSARTLNYAEGVQQSTETLNRLGGYLIPKTSSVDFTLIRAAMDRGEADVRLHEQRRAACAGACKGDADCLKRCADKALDARLDECATAAFLPF
jgi:hypothetical protein